MPTLHFKGKTFVQNHHLAVKYHQLVPKKEFSLTEKVSLHDNLIIQGDNLKALKALLPTYAGKVKCIYIDPPYNTGNEKWVYNDNVNSPMIQEWLGSIVDKEDMTRHDKWMCMMMPRLKLLRELLSEDGAIFISIDDNEIHHLRCMMDEIFGESNFLGQVSRVTGTPTGLGNKGLVSEIDYVVIYSKGESELFNGLQMDEKQSSIYNQEDENGRYLTRPLRKTGGEDKREDRPSMYFPVTAPNGKEIYPVGPTGYESRWRCSPDKYKKLVEAKQIEWKQDKEGDWKPYLKFYLEGRLKHPTNLWQNIEGNKKASLDVKTIFGEKKFDYPKPVELIKRCLEIYSDDDSIILDSFAGSGTTAQAVLELNKEDEGERKFILVEMEDYANTITAERVRRVIKGVKTAKSELLKKGTGGSFSYFELGDTIEMESLLIGKNLPSFTEFARYLFYTATGEEFNEKAINEKTGFIGESKNYEAYLLYKADIDWLKKNALTLEFCKSLPKFKNKQRLVFAPAKYVDDHTLLDYRIDFCQLPYEIYRIQR